MKASEARYKLNKIIAQKSCMKKALPLIEKAIQDTGHFIIMKITELSEEEAKCLRDDWGYKVLWNFDNSGNGYDRSDKLTSYTIEW